MFLKLASDKGFKYRYINHDSNGHNIVKYNINEQTIDVMDCCEYVSWNVNKGTEDPFYWGNIGSFNNNMDEEIDILQELQGDVLVNNKHVTIIIANNP